MVIVATGKGGTSTRGREDATGKAMFQMLGVFSEFERAMIRERVNAGLARTKANDKTLSRPKSKVSEEKAIQATLAGGIGIILKTAKKHSVGTSFV